MIQALRNGCVAARLRCQEHVMTEIPIRHAASLLLLGGSSAETTVLMGMRGAGHRFMPNRLVFPGGAVDAEDHDAALASLPHPGVLARLARDGGDSLARGLLHAAARELEEEAGLHLGRPPDTSGLDYLCRAITPAAQPIRFDARFFVAPAELAAGLPADSDELHDLRWFGIDEALALDLAFPTRKVLEQLVVWQALNEAERLARDLTPTLRDRSWFME
jgi:8-oxo-dGTP pyrophosphatase MutT (NUDIX family)